MSSAASHYQALGVSPDAAFADIKASYRAAILQLHPDKAATATRLAPSLSSWPDLDGAVELGSSGLPAGERVACSTELLAVQSAWEVLADPHRRATYDRLLAAERARNNVAIAEHLDLDDLSISNRVGQHSSTIPGAADSRATGGVVFSHPCRCSGSYLLQEEDLSETADSVVVACSSCSLHIRVSYSVY